MTLTSEHMNALKQPFAPEDHEWLQGNAFIKESPITNRIEDVDPAWSFSVDEIIMDTPELVTVRATLTIHGVSRSNTGSQQRKYKAIYEGKKKIGEMDHIPENESGEATKSATTDALKRCARLFGVGRYLLDLPDNVRDENSLKRFLGQPQPTVDPLDTLRDLVHKETGLTDDELAKLAGIESFTRDALKAKYDSTFDAKAAIIEAYNKPAQPKVAPATPKTETEPPTNGNTPAQPVLIDAPQKPTEDRTYNDPF